MVGKFEVMYNWQTRKKLPEYLNMFTCLKELLFFFNISFSSVEDTSRISLDRIEYYF